MQENPNELSYREYPVSLVLFSFLSFGVAAYFFLQNSAWTASAIAFALGALLLLMASILDVSANRITRKLSISRRGIIQHYHKEIDFSEIDLIQVGSHQDTDTSSRSYRIEITLKNGAILPFRNAYSGGRAAKEKRAKKLREFIGVGGADRSFGNLFRTAQQAATGQLQPQFRAEQEAITGDQNQIHETQGVRWQTETITFGNTPLLRWKSTDIFLPQSFLYLAQIPKDAIRLSDNKVTRQLSTPLFKHSLQLYGFSKEYTPDINTAQTIDLPADLGAYFTAYTDEPARAQQIINPWMIQALIRWAREHPLRKTSDQLTLLLGPKGLIMAMPGLMNAEFLDEFAALGAELVRSQQ